MDLNADLLSRRAKYQRLMDESAHILDNALGTRGIRVHSRISRLKTHESVLAKAERKDLRDPYNELNDIAGLRVVCRFLSDLSAIEEAIRSSFSVLTVDNKIEGPDTSSFGYMSLHYVVQIKDEYVGPRYDGLHGIPLEIQVRTILMDAWATISHYLDYKAESSIPSELRKDFHAISAILYTADKHFELFFLESKASRQRATETVSQSKPSLNQELNLDNLIPYLEFRFPDREKSPPQIVSELVGELVAVGYKSIGEVDTDLRAAEQAALSYEKDHPPDNPTKRYAGVGIARSAIAIANRDYRSMQYPGRSFEPYTRRLTSPPRSRP